jgi:hypothetical protein
MAMKEIKTCILHGQVIEDKVKKEVEATVHSFTPWKFVNAMM